MWNRSLCSILMKSTWIWMAKTSSILSYVLFLIMASDDIWNIYRYISIIQVNAAWFFTQKVLREIRQRSLNNQTTVRVSSPEAAHPRGFQPRFRLWFPPYGRADIQYRTCHIKNETIPFGLCYSLMLVTGLLVCIHVTHEREVINLWMLFSFLKKRREAQFLSQFFINQNNHIAFSLRSPGHDGEPKAHDVVWRLCEN